jgi:hypothetical protein
MASKMKWRKLVPDKRGLAELTRPRPADEAAMPLRLPGPKTTSAKPPRTITVAMQELPAIPQRVPIRHRGPSTRPRPTLL